MKKGVTAVLFLALLVVLVAGCGAEAADDERPPIRSALECVSEGEVLQITQKSGQEVGCFVIDPTSKRFLQEHRDDDQPSSLCVYDELGHTAMVGSTLEVFPDAPPGETADYADAMEMLQGLDWTDADLTGPETVDGREVLRLDRTEVFEMYGMPVTKTAVAYADEKTGMVMREELILESKDLDEETSELIIEYEVIDMTPELDAMLDRKNLREYAANEWDRRLEKLKTLPYYGLPDGAEGLHLRYIELFTDWSHVTLTYQPEDAHWGTPRVSIFLYDTTMAVDQWADYWAKTRVPLENAVVDADGRRLSYMVGDIGIRIQVDERLDIDCRTLARELVPASRLTGSYAPYKEVSGSPSIPNGA